MSAHRVDVVKLDKFPTIALRDFYLSPECKQVHAVYKTGEIQDLVARIGDEKAVVVLKGTGTYSYFWKEQLQKKGIFMLVAVSMDGEIDSPESRWHRQQRRRV